MAPRLPKPTCPTHPPYASHSPIAVLYAAKAPWTPPPPVLLHPNALCTPGPIFAPLLRTHSGHPSTRSSNAARHSAAADPPMVCGAAPPPPPL